MLHLWSSECKNLVLLTKLIKSVCLLKKNQKWMARLLALASKWNWIHSVKGVVLMELQLGKFSFLLLLSKKLYPDFCICPMCILQISINKYCTKSLSSEFLFCFCLLLFLSMSMGFLVEEGAPIVWRGLMVSWTFKWLCFLFLSWNKGKFKFAFRD